MTWQVRERVTATRSYMYWGQNVCTYCAHFPHTTKLTFSKHLLTAKWIYDRSLFSHTLHIGCAHLRAWGHGYPRSGCNFHSRVCMGSGVWQCLKLRGWCFNPRGIAWIETKSHSNLTHTPPPPLKHPLLLPYSSVYPPHPSLQTCVVLAFCCVFLLRILHLTHSCPSSCSYSSLYFDYIWTCLDFYIIKESF